MRWLPWFSALHRRRLLWGLLASLVLPWSVGAAVKASMQAGLHDDASRAAQLVDILVVATTAFLVVSVATVAMGCWVVAVMKGPARCADAYPVEPPQRDRA
jgi:hypothetical protein